MRRCLVAVTFLCLQSNIALYAQDVTIKYNHVPLIRILKAIQRITPYRFSFEENDIRYLTDVSIDVVNFSLEDLLPRLFRGLPLGYKTKIVKDLTFVSIYRINGVPLTGRVLNDSGEVQIGANVEVIYGHIGTVTDDHGGFTLYEVPDTAVLRVSGVNIEPTLVRPHGKTHLDIHVKRKTSNMPGVMVCRPIENGLQRIPASESTGSVATVDKKAIREVISPNLLDGLKGRLSGLSFGPETHNEPPLAVRGRNSFYAPGAPSIVWDNYIHFGGLDDINPNDVETVTLLKDAASAGVWGSFAANGVLVITSSTGEYRKPLSVTLTANTTFTDKPDLGYWSWMSPHSYIDAERQLFDRGYYNNVRFNPSYALTPAVDSLYALTGPKRDGTLSQLAGHSTLSDLSSYFYRHRVSQQYHIALSGGSQLQKFYVSLGYDHDPTALVRNGYERYTLHGSQTYQVVPRRLELSTLFHFAETGTRLDNTGTIPIAYPYARLADDKGNALPVSYMYNQRYIDTAGGGLLQDWHYRPLEELLLADRTSHRYLGHLQTALTYTFDSGFSAAILYRYTKGVAVMRDCHDHRGFDVRDLYNSFVQPAGPVLYPIPQGDILDVTDSLFTGHNLRAQLSYASPAGKHNQWRALTGAELDDFSITADSYRRYGYTDQRGTSVPVNLADDYLNFITHQKQKIPTGENPPVGVFNHYVSTFSTLSYSHDNRYTLYGALRGDASNIRGVQTGRQWAPFWSVGMNWDLTKRDSGKEKKYHPLLKLRSSYGCNGNVGNRTADLTIENLGMNSYNSPQAGIVNPSNPGLTWEKNNILNMGLDVAFFRDSISSGGRLSGSLDIYHKWVNRVLGQDTLPPSTGLSGYIGNTAAIRGYGLDLVLNSVNTRGKWQWTSSLLLSVAVDRVSRYLYQPVSPNSYVLGRYPRVGRSPSALFSYDWGGLDTAGNPQGYQGSQNRKLSTNYSALMSQADGNFHYSGTYQPTVFGSLDNTIACRQWSLSFRLLYKLGYVFRRSSINYSSLATGSSPGHTDYDRRWQTPGDEKRTDIPSFPRSIDPNRDAFYLNSAALVTRGDHIRLQDFRVSYTWLRDSARTLPFRKLTFYMYLNNLYILWRANHNGIDPDASIYGSLPMPRTYSLGVRAEF